MLFHRSARTVGIVMEEQKTLGQLTIVESLGLQHVGNHSLIVALRNQGVNTFAFVLLTFSIEGIEESKVVDAVEIFLLKISGGHIIVGRKE